MAEDHEISQKNFEKLLTWLNSDRELAGRKYESIRLGLIKVFTLRGCQTADELADATIDIVIKKIDSILENYNGEPALYFYGVGKKVFSQFLKTPQIKDLSYPVIQTEKEDENTLQKHECLDSCLQKLTKEQRELVIAYYQDDKREKINQRKNLADKRGISSDKLRVQIHRIKIILEKCVRQCMEDTDK